MDVFGSEEDGQNFLKARCARSGTGQFSALLRPRRHVLRQRRQHLLLQLAASHVLQLFYEAGAAAVLRARQLLQSEQQRQHRPRPRSAHDDEEGCRLHSRGFGVKWLSLASPFRKAKKLNPPEIYTDLAKNRLRRLGVPVGGAARPGFRTPPRTRVLSRRPGVVPPYRKKRSFPFIFEAPEAPEQDMSKH